jgi:hypothetical protein
MGIIKKISEVFTIIQGHQITEEEIYNSFGDVPIFTGNNRLIGEVNTSIIKSNDLPCISYPTKGQVGNFFIKRALFEANNTAVSLPKQEWKGRINLYWFISQISPKVKKECNSKAGVGYIGKEIMQRITFDIVDKPRQILIGNLYNTAREFKNGISETIKSLEYDLQGIKSVFISPRFKGKFSTFFNITGGNSGLTEEFIYHNQPSTEEEKIEIFTGATLDENKMGFISRFAKPNRTKLKIFQSPAILVVRKGLAGKMFYIEKDEFTTNDDAYVLTSNEDWKDKINLKWFIRESQDLFFNLVTSKSDNATFDKGYASRQIVKIPNMKFQNEFVEKIEYIESIITKLNKIEKEIDEGLECVIV